MNNQLTRYTIGALLLVAVVLSGCGSESDSNITSSSLTNNGNSSSSDVSLNPSANSEPDPIDARMSLHTGELVDVESIASRTSTPFALPYAVVGCYGVKDFVCKTPSGELKKINTNDMGICFEKFGSDYYLHQKEWKYPVTASTDKKRWTSLFREIGENGFTQVEIESQTMASNQTLENFDVKVTYKDLSKCGEKLIEMQCTAKLAFNANSYMETRNKIYDEKQFHDEVCLGIDSDAKPNLEPSQKQTDKPVLPNWIKQETGVASSLNAIAYGNGKYVAVGNSGIILNSIDAKTWKFITYLDDAALRTVAFGNGKFVAGGYNGKYVSTDGETWEKVKSNSVLKVIRMGSNFILIDWNGYGAYHADVCNDSGGCSGFSMEDYKVSLNNITHGDGVLLAVGSKGEILTCSDYPNLELKSQKSPTVNPIHNVAYGDGTFIIIDALNKVFASKDNGVSWTQMENPAPTMSSVIYNNGKFIGVGYSNIYESVDGEKWTSIATFSGSVEDFIFDGSKYVGVGWSGLIFTIE